MSTLPALTGPPVVPGDRLVFGLGSGRVTTDPTAIGPRHGRRRRWSYAAAADGEVAVGAAIVDLGFAATAFAWATVGDRLVTWDRTALLGVGVSVGATPAAGARAGRWIAIDAAGGLRIDVPTDDGRLVATTTVTDPGLPAVLATATAGGGWNVTEKAAGGPCEGSITLDGVTTALRDGGSWRDWTAGRQDRRTRWRWAAAVGSDRAGRRIGINVSTGMNAAGAGEDVVWWDGVPHPLAVTALAPAGEDPAGPWRLGGPGWQLDVRTTGVRAADEELLFVRSRYVQPIGHFEGTLPGPDGAPVEVVLHGVTEDHEARW